MHPVAECSCVCKCGMPGGGNNPVINSTTPHLQSIQRCVTEFMISEACIQFQHSALAVFGRDLQCQQVRGRHPRGMPLGTRMAALQTTSKGGIPNYILECKCLSNNAHPSQQQPAAYSCWLLRRYWLLEREEHQTTTAASHILSTLLQSCSSA
jgi:hypothetical protein